MSTANASALAKACVTPGPARRPKRLATGRQTRAAGLAFWCVVAPACGATPTEDPLLRDVVRCVEGGPFQTSDLVPFASRAGHRMVALPSGERRVSVLAGYRVMLSTAAGAYFVNLKVERSAADAFDGDRNTILEQMTALARRLPGGEAALLRSNEGGVETFGLTQPSLDTPGPLSFYTLLAPKLSVIASAYVLNQAEGVRSFKDMDGYAALRDKALSVVASCLRTHGA